ncbi:MAG: hypothetical protein ACI9YP_000909, partial [Colwellia sp.]
ESKKDDKAESETHVEFIMLPLVLFLIKVSLLMPMH